MSDYRSMYVMCFSGFLKVPIMDFKKSFKKNTKFRIIFTSNLVCHNVIDILTERIVYILCHSGTDQFNDAILDKNELNDF